MNVLLLTSHAIAEHDDLEMFTRMGLPVYSIGGAYDETPFEGKRPPVPNVVRYPDLEAATNEQRARLSADLGDPEHNIDWAKARLAPEVIDWADTIIVHHFPEQWIGGQWDAIKGKRVIWRTCGQSDPRLEASMLRYARQGMQIVRYSPKEADAFMAWGAFAGQDALIRFGKDPDEWSGWHGNGRVSILSENDVAWGTPVHEKDARPFVANITQHMAQRGDACGYGFWTEATHGLEAHPAGPGSEELPGGIGPLDYEAMKSYLRAARVYLYTGTRPASYTLGLIEAMMTGTPVVSMGAGQFHPAALFEAHEITGLAPSPDDSDPVGATRSLLRYALDGDWSATSRQMRERAIDLFGLDKIMGQWAEFLGHGVVQPRSTTTEFRIVA